MCRRTVCFFCFFAVYVVTTDNQDYLTSHGVFHRQCGKAALGCFGTFCYGFIGQNKEWFEAQTNCWKIFNKNACLVSIYSESENNYISRLLRRYKYNSIHPLVSPVDVWTSGYVRSFNSSQLSDLKWLLKDTFVNMTWMAEWEDIPSDLDLCSVVVALSYNSGYKKWKIVDQTSYHIKAQSLCKWPTVNNCPCGVKELPNDVTIDTITSRCSTTTGSTPGSTASSTHTTESTIFHSLTGRESTSTSWTFTTSMERSSLSTGNPSVAPATSGSPGVVCEARLAHGCWWPQTRAGETAVAKCPLGSTGNATWHCDMDGIFIPVDSPDFSDCHHTWIDDLYALIIGNTSAVNLSEVLLEKSFETEEFYSEDLLLIQDVVLLLLEKYGNNTAVTTDTEMSTEFSTNLVSTVNLLLEPRQEAAWYGLEKNISTVATQLTENVQNVGFIFASGFDDDGGHLAENNLEIYVERRPRDYYNDTDYIFNVTNSSLSGWTGASVKLYAGFQEQLRPSENLSIVVVMYANVQTFLDNSSHNGEQVSVMSNVLDISIGDRNAEEMQFPQGGFQFELPHVYKDAAYQHICAFWNKSRYSYAELDWSGCEVLSQNEYFTSCSCSHMTNFAILLDFNDVLDKMDYTSGRILEITSVVLTSASIVCLVFCILMLLSFKSNGNIKITITRNLCTCLLLENIIMVSLLQATNSKIICAAIAGVLEYVLLSAFSWMLLEGIHLYRLLVFVFDTSCNKLPWYYLTGYGVPFIIVILSVSVYPCKYGTDKYCWIDTRSNAIWTFAGPVIAVIVSNTFILIMALRIAAGVKMKTTRTRLQQFRKSTVGALSLTSILGITWIFGYFYLDVSTLFFAYVFTILNASQGIFVFIFHCLINGNIRRNFTRRFIASKFDPTQITNKVDISKIKRSTKKEERSRNAIIDDHWIFYSPSSRSSQET